jgi:hypothetical protein
MSVQPIVQSLTIRYGCIGCNKRCIYSDKSIRTDALATKQGNNFGCNSENE